MKSVRDCMCMTRTHSMFQLPATVFSDSCQWPNNIITALSQSQSSLVRSSRNVHDSKCTWI